MLEDNIRQLQRKIDDAMMQHHLLGVGGGGGGGSGGARGFSHGGGSLPVITSSEGLTLAKLQEAVRSLGERLQSAGQAMDRNAHSISQMLGHGREVKINMPVYAATYATTLWHTSNGTTSTTTPTVRFVTPPVAGADLPDVDVSGVPPHYRQPPPRHFNRFLNASDLMEEFVREMGELGVKQGEFMKLPTDLFINWLVIKAAEADGEGPPEGVRLALPPGVRALPSRCGRGHFVSNDYDCRACLRLAA
jgi:hypothetical protein